MKENKEREEWEQRTRLWLNSEPLDGRAKRGNVCLPARQQRPNPTFDGHRRSSCSAGGEVPLDLPDFVWQVFGAAALKAGLRNIKEQSPDRFKLKRNPIVLVRHVGPLCSWTGKSQTKKDFLQIQTQHDWSLDWATAPSHKRKLSYGGSEMVPGLYGNMWLLAHWWQRLDLMFL